MVVKVTQSSRIRGIADRLNVPVPVVKRIIDEYIAGLQQSALNGEDVEVRGLFAIRMLQDGNSFIPRGVVSPVLKEKLRNG